MAHGFLKNMDTRLQVYSAGTEPSGKVHPKAIRVMSELGIDISEHSSDSIESFLDEKWDYVITVCGDARDNCPVFQGKVKERRHIGFDDPVHVVGSEEIVLGAFRRVRDEIKFEFEAFYKNELIPILHD
jgi:arsenate reductase